MEQQKRHAPATQRNRQAILDVIQGALPDAGTVLEVASGSGEHCVYFAEALSNLTWQPSDPDPAARESIHAWINGSGLSNVLPALELDAASEVWPLDAIDAIMCINMIHISPWKAAIGLFKGASLILPKNGSLYLYGPYKRNSAHTSESNHAFDASLRARNPEWGIRDLEAIVALAEDSGFRFNRSVDMPANNLSLLFDRL